MGRGPSFTPRGFLKSGIPGASISTARATRSCTYLWRAERCLMPLVFSTRSTIGIRCKAWGWLADETCLLSRDRGQRPNLQLHGKCSAELQTSRRHTRHYPHPPLASPSHSRHLTPRELSRGVPLLPSPSTSFMLPIDSTILQK